MVHTALSDQRNPGRVLGVEVVHTALSDQTQPWSSPGRGGSAYSSVRSNATLIESWTWVWYIQLYQINATLVESWTWRWCMQLHQINATLVESWTWRWCIQLYQDQRNPGRVLGVEVVHAASDQVQRSSYILHGAYYLNDRGIGPKASCCTWSRPLSGNSRLLEIQAATSGPPHGGRRRKLQCF